MIGVSTAALVRGWLNRAGCAVVAAWLLLPVPAACAAAGADGSDTETVQTFAVEGFRSARFDMTEAQVRQAILTDFKVSAKEIAKEKNDIERTTVLNVGVDGLLPVGGVARISYILGFKSERLTQINVTWGHGSGRTAGSEALVAAANLLRQHFQGKGFVAESVVVNGQLPDGSILVFRGSDREGRMAVLVLTGDRPAAKPDGDRSAVKPTSLQLSYIKDIHRPDVFKLAPDAF